MLRCCWSALSATVALGLIGQSGPAAAHPHVWITDVTTFLFKERQLVGIHHHWSFDEIFSSFVIQEHDRDGNGAFDQPETASVQAAAFSKLREYGYFTHLRVDGDPLPLDQVEDFQATIVDGVLSYDFTLTLPAVVEPAAQTLVVGIYDPEYYVEVLLDENDPVRFSGSPSGVCTFDIKEDVDTPIYFGMVYPLAIRLNCATS